MSRRKGQKSPRTVCVGLRRASWWLIRKDGQITLDTLLRTYADGDQRDPYGNLRQYLRALVRAGVLGASEREPGEALTSNGRLLYRLEMDLGRIAPVARKDGVWDPNGKRLLPWITVPTYTNRRKDQTMEDRP
jgi:hypothetical protein